MLYVYINNESYDVAILVSVFIYSVYKQIIFYNTMLLSAYMHLLLLCSSIITIEIVLSQLFSLLSCNHPSHLIPNLFLSSYLFHCWSYVMLQSFVFVTCWQRIFIMHVFVCRPGVGSLMTSGIVFYLFYLQTVIPEDSSMGDLQVSTWSFIILVFILPLMFLLFFFL